MSEDPRHLLTPFEVIIERTAEGIARLHRGPDAEVTDEDREKARHALELATREPKPLDAPKPTPRFLAAIDLMRRTGAHAFQLRYSDEEKPTVWIAVAIYDDRVAETAAALNPELAVLRLAERIIDGGICSHCERPAAFSRYDDEQSDPLPEGHPLQGVEVGLCWYTFDPESKKYERGCLSTHPEPEPTVG